jgi:hypothetical protein
MNAKTKQDKAVSSEEKHGPASNIRTIVVDSLKVLDPSRTFLN